MTQEIVAPSQIGKYEITSVLGGGAFATVYKARNVETSAIYAIKVILKSSIADDGTRERLQRELDTMAYIKHESIVQMYDFLEDSQNFYLVIDYCEGGELADYIRSNPKLREPVAATIFAQIISAIAYCHTRGIAHRDLKPENILLTQFPTVKVADFGLCGYWRDVHWKMDTFCGSPFYAAPECLNMQKYDGMLSDVWSLGVILFELVSGQFPWSTSNTPQMIKQIMSASYEIPDGVSACCHDLIKSMIKLRPACRIKSLEILNHPWLNLAKRGKKRTLTPLMSPKQLFAVISMKGRDENILGKTIVSPFATKALVDGGGDKSKTPRAKDANEPTSARIKQGGPAHLPGLARAQTNRRLTK
jgi:serine/threonine protein kinase